ncbi:MAG: transposase [Flexilinea sp.]
MEDILERSIGIDIHKKSIVCTKLTGKLGKKPESETKIFGTLSEDLNELRKWIEESGCHDIAMESTGVYWIPIFERLVDCFRGDISIIVVNARYMKNIPGKKTDIRDSEWKAKLLRSGLLNGSFVPGRHFREIRQLTRYCQSINHEIVAQKNRIEKFLQSSGFRLSSFLTDKFGVSGMNILQIIKEKSCITRDELNGCVKLSARKKLASIMAFVNGGLSLHE